jgi:hypothetical protein
MDFNLEKSIAILERTPATLTAMLLGLPEEWLMSNEGGESWSPYDVVGHLFRWKILTGYPAPVLSSKLGHRAI